MLYYLFTYLDEKFDFVGAGVFQYITFRSGMAVILSLVIAMLFGRKYIDFLRKKQIGESVRDLGLDGQKEKQQCFPFVFFSFQISSPLTQEENARKSSFFSPDLLPRVLVSFAAK